MTLTRAEALDWPGRKGRIGGDLLRQAISNLATQPVFICGPTSMMEPTIQLLREQGVPGDQIRSEAFLAAKRTDVARMVAGVEASPDISAAGGASPDLAIDQTGPPALTFARSAKRALLSQEKSLLELSEEAGLKSITNAAPASVAGARPSCWRVVSLWKSSMPWTRRTRRTTSYCCAKPSPPTTSRSRRERVGA